ncbi:MAG: hypothetical protein ABIK79_15700 [Chloroflexota bacterium]
MVRDRRSNLAGGVVLILIGVLLLVFQVMPGLQVWASWPLIIIGVGVLLLTIGVLTGVPAMAIPACIVGGVGGLLYWQNVTGNWESWVYVWTLIPGFVGVGIILSGLFGGEIRQSLGVGGWLILISLVLFAVFGSFFGRAGLLGAYWPVLLIAMGLFLLARPLFRTRP